MVKPPRVKPPRSLPVIIPKRQLHTLPVSMASVSKRDADFDVVIIGAGWAGIVMCKYALEVGLTVRVLEARDDIGGVWYYSDDPKHITVMRSTIMSSSATLTEMSDFPMPPEQGDFLSHSQVHDYLKAYCRKYDLHKHMEFNSPVTSTQRLRDKWEVSTAKGRSYTATHLTICSGLHQEPNTELKDTLFKKFTGKIQHSSQIKKFDESHRDKVVLVLGGGETASDIVETWHGQAKRIIWSVPSGQQFFRKFAKLLPHRKPQALDKASSVVLDLIGPHCLGKPGFAWVCKWTSNGSLLAYQGHGIPEFRNEVPYLRQFVNKHAHVLDLIDYDHLIPKAGIAFVDGNTVAFKDGSQFHVDNIVLCTGYRETFPFLPHNYLNNKVADCFKYCLHASDPSLAYVGFVRPVIGSIPLAIELQSQMITKMWSGRVPMPNSKRLLKSAREDKARWQAYFKSKGDYRIGALVDEFQYSKELLREAGTMPCFRKLLFECPRDFFGIIFAPAMAAISKVSDPETRPVAMASIRYHTSGCISPFVLLLILFLRLIWFDWILDQLSFVKYRIQSNAFCQYFSTYKIVRLANHAWTWPKRMIFDDQSHHLLGKSSKHK